MTKKELKDYLVEEYGEDPDELKDYTKKELEELLEEYGDHSMLYPNGDEFDGSHEWD